MSLILTKSAREIIIKIYQRLTEGVPHLTAVFILDGYLTNVLFLKKDAR